MAERASRGGARLVVLPNAALAASAAATIITEHLASALATNGRFSLALSGGSTPKPMLEALAAAHSDWSQVHVFQVDERVVPRDDEARNARQLDAAFLSRVSIPSWQCHLMPVESAGPASAYANTLHACLGEPAVLDLVHLGLGEDGHTASLVPGDPALAVTDRDVVAVSEYRGHARVSLTFPILNRARCVLWLVCGAGKRGVLARLIEGSLDAPAGRVLRERAVIVADADAAPT